MYVELTRRAHLHAAMGEEHRLTIVDALRLSDRTPTELRAVTGLDSNLLAFHLDVLEEAGLITRRRSQGDARRRYVRLNRDALASVGTVAEVPDGPVLFVCTRNAARSQLAAALWRDVAGRQASSAGTDPAEDIDPIARQVAARHGLDLGAQRPRRYDEIDEDPGLVVSVCDRARESGLPWPAPHLHWSVSDPAGGDLAAYEAALGDLRGRIEDLASVARGAAA